MADPVDRSDQESEAFLTAAMSKRRKEGPVANGKCFCCGAALAHGLRWCDRLCREDWELDESIKERGRL